MGLFVAMWRSEMEVKGRCAPDNVCRASWPNIGFRFPDIHIRSFAPRKILRFVRGL